VDVYVRMTGKLCDPIAWVGVGLAVGIKDITLTTVGKKLTSFSSRR
jgi:hypothetical protein